MKILTSRTYPFNPRVQVALVSALAVYKLNNKRAHQALAQEVTLAASAEDRTTLEDLLALPKGP